MESTLMSEVTTVNLYWIWTVVGAALVFGLAGFLAGASALWRQRRERQVMLKRIHALERNLKALAMSSIQVGEKLVGVTDELHQAVERQSELEQRDPGQLPYRQAARLVGLGASVDDLVESCGLSRPEAELLNLLQGGGVRTVAKAGGVQRGSSH